MKKLLAIVFVLFIFCGCEDRPTNGSYDLEEIPLEKVGKIQYKLVKIEGKTFIATQDRDGYYYFAGPID